MFWIIKTCPNLHRLPKELNLGVTQTKPTWQQILVASQRGIISKCSLWNWHPRCLFSTESTWSQKKKLKTIWSLSDSTLFCWSLPAPRQVHTPQCCWETSTVSMRRALPFLGLDIPKTTGRYSTVSGFYFLWKSPDMTVKGASRFRQD